jgi:hypothetical protein
MNMKNTVSLGAAVVAILGAVAFVPASADSRDEAAVQATATIAMTTVAETPQDQVWDMTYGPDRPVAIEVAAAPAQADEEIVDYTFG